MENHVLRKMRRAGIVIACAAGLTFVGIAPANALSGQGWQTSDLGKNGTAVAQLAVPKGDGTIGYKYCSGVLVKPNEVLTSSDCFSFSNDPYHDVFARESTTTEDNLATKTARVTFGKDAEQNNKSQDRVYFSVRVETPASSAWGLSIVQLDRPVTGITPVSKASGITKDGTIGNLLGWETTDFVPMPGAIPTTITSNDKNIAYRALSGYEVSPLTWEQFEATGKSIPEIDMPSAGDKTAVVPGFRVKGIRVSKENTKELGSPVVTTDGKLQGILVGYDKNGQAVFLDAGEPNISDWIYRAHTQRILEKKEKVSSEKALSGQYKDLRDLMCGNPAASDMKTFESYAITNGNSTNNSINTHNEYVTNLGHPEFKYAHTDNHAPNYPVTSTNDPSYIKDISKDAPTLQAMCQPGGENRKLDLVTMYQRAITEEQHYQVERGKIQKKVTDAEIAKNLAEQAYKTAQTEEAKAYSYYKVDISDSTNKKKWEDAVANTKAKKTDMEGKVKEYNVLLELQEQVVKSLDPVVSDALGAVKNGMLELEAKVEAAQNDWADKDDAFRKAYDDAMSKYLAELKKKADNAVKAEENTTYCIGHPDDTKCGDPKGYPKAYERVNQSILDKDPYSEYLVLGGGKDQVERDLGAYAEPLNQTVPIMLEARYQIWNMTRMTDMLKKGAVLNPADKEAMRQEIMELLDKQEELKNQISTANGKMQEAATNLKKSYETLPEALKNYLKEKGYDQVIQDFNNVNLAYNGAKTDLKNLDQVRDELPDAATTTQMDSLLNKASKSYANLMDILDQVTAATNKLSELNAISELAKKGLIKDDDDPTAGMTPAEKEKYEKEQAAKKAAEEAAAKKAADAAAKKAEAEAKKAAAEAEKKAKADEKRLAKALSKNTLRAEGANRVLTSIAAWKIGKFPGDSLVLVDGNVHADGLSATPFAAGLKAPILLTQWKTGLEPALMDQIKASGKKKLYLVGWQVPMTPYDEFELRDAGIDIIRIAGSDRYATSVALNQATEPLIGASPQKPLHLYVADGIGFPDALAAGAAAGRVGGLMLLSRGTTLDPQTYNYISNLGQTRPLKITAVGGPAVTAIKNTPWPTTMSVEIDPVMGSDRYETAAKLSTTLPGTTAAVLATGEKFADALAGGSLAVDQNAALVLTKSKELPNAAYQSLQRYGSEKTIVVGGPAAVSAKVAELVNGATLKNPDSVNIEGTLAAREQVKAAVAAKALEDQKNALETVKGMIKNGSDLQSVMNQLGIGSVDQLAKLLSQPAGTYGT